MLISEPITTKRKKLRHAEYYDMQTTFDLLYERSKNGNVFTNLMSIITAEENIKLAYRNIKANNGSNTKGTDGKTIKYISKMPQDKFLKIVQNKFKWYKPQKVRRVDIPKANGKTRPLGIPTIWDRLIQQCILQVLEPICEAKFHERNNGFRPNRSVENAIAQCYKMINHYKCFYVVDIDIKGFFDNVNHAKLLKQIWTLGIKDKKLICIIGAMLKAPIQMPNGDIVTPDKGTPQGGILSPLLSNIVLNELDWWISNQWETFETKHNYSGKVNRDGTIQQSSKYRGLRRSSKLKEMYIIRYADDFKIFCKKYNEAKRIFEAIKLWLKERLKLDISVEKSCLINLKRNYSNYLGFRIKAITKRKKYIAVSRMTEKAFENTKIKLKNQLINIEKPRTSQADEITLYNSMVMGIHNYFKYATLISIDCNEIHKRILKRLKGGMTNLVKRVGRLNNPILIEKYGKSKNMRYINEIPVLPISYVQHQNPMYKIKEICPYTEKGRELIHKNLGVNIKILMKLMREKQYNKSTAYMDNRVSLYCAQYGKCAISGKVLEYDEIHCHHILPRHKGGNDTYKNLIILHKDTHILVHASDETTINKYLNNLKLQPKQIEKLNKLREQVGNKIIE
ncbi:MAG: group II intron reverse transcriptase/maturase [Acholeplasmatales bacterium]|nr:group II intron reverse transcriptase/maturase [Acholeplasmatales bacterium]